MLTSLPLPYHNKRSPAHSGDELPFLGDELQNRGRAAHRQGAGGNTKAAALCQARRRADEIIGPYAEGRHPQGVRRAAVPGPAARMPCIVGRAFTPAGEGCGKPGGYWHGKVPHPSVAWGDTSPARGGGCAARRRRRGALPVCGKNILQGQAGPCPASVGDDACIVPETLRCRKTPGGGRKRPPYIAARSGRQYESGSPLPGPPAGRCKHRPLRRGAASAGCAAGCRSRSRRPYALHCRAGVHARRGGALRQPRRILARQGAAPLSRLTPTAPRTGEPFGWKPFTKPPLQGEVDAPQGADGGVHCRLAAKISCKARQALALPP